MRPSSSNARGFSLLEVMVAFVILTFVTGTVVAQFWESVNATTTAVNQRELREAAESLFRRILYEREKWEDGDGGFMGKEYAEWTGLGSKLQDKWNDFRWELEKTPQLAAGNTDDGDVESVFGEDESEDDTSTDEEGEEEGEGVQLMRVVLRIYDVESGKTEHLVVLATYQPHDGDNE